MKLVSVAHTVFKNGGSWSYFRCPKCGGRAKKLWIVNDAPRCRTCLEKLGVRYRSAYAFGQTERLRVRDQRVDRLQAMLEGGPLRLKPVPPSWGNRRLDRRIRLTWASPPPGIPELSEDSAVVYTAACTKRSASTA